MNMSKKLLFIFITFLSFILFSNSVYAACSDIKIDTVTGIENENDIKKRQELIKECKESTENGFACYLDEHTSENSGYTIYRCKKSNTCAIGYYVYGGKCIKESSGDEGEIDTKCSSYTVEDDCKTRMNCEWINGICTTAYVAEDPCSESDILKTFRFYGFLLMIAKVAVPLIIIVMGTFDLFKSVVDKDEKSLSKQVRMLLMRVVAGIFIFFLPTIVYAIFDISTDLNIVSDAKYKACVDCLLKPTGCNTEVTPKTQEEDPTSDGFADSNGNCSEGYTKGIDGICYKIGVCGSFTTKETCPESCKWSNRNGCIKK